MSRFPPPCDEAIFLVERKYIANPLSQYEVMSDEEWEWNRKITKEGNQDNIPLLFKSIPTEEWAVHRKRLMKNVGQYMSEHLSRKD